MGAYYPGRRPPTYQELVDQQLEHERRVREYLGGDPPTEDEYLGRLPDVSPEPPPKSQELQDLENSAIGNDTRRWILSHPPRTAIGKFNDEFSEKYLRPIAEGYEKYVKPPMEVLTRAPQAITDAATDFANKITTPRLHGQEEGDNDADVPVGKILQAGNPLMYPFRDVYATPAEMRGFYGGGAQGAASQATLLNLIMLGRGKAVQGVLGAGGRALARAADYGLRGVEAAGGAYSSTEGAKRGLEALQRGEYKEAAIELGLALTGAAATVHGAVTPTELPVDRSGYRHRVTGEVVPEAPPPNVPPERGLPGTSPGGRRTGNPAYSHMSTDQVGNAWWTASQSGDPYGNAQSLLEELAWRRQQAQTAGQGPQPRGPGAPTREPIQTTVEPRSREVPYRYEEPVPGAPPDLPVRDAEIMPDEPVDRTRLPGEEGPPPGPPQLPGPGGTGGGPTPLGPSPLGTPVPPEPRYGGAVRAQYPGGFYEGEVLPGGEPGPPAGPAGRALDRAQQPPPPPPPPPGAPPVGPPVVAPGPYKLTKEDKAILTQRYGDPATAPPDRRQGIANIWEAYRQAREQEVQGGQAPAAPSRPYKGEIPAVTKGTKPLIDAIANAAGQELYVTAGGQRLRVQPSGYGTFGQVTGGIIKLDGGSEIAADLVDGLEDANGNRIWGRPQGPPEAPPAAPVAPRPRPRPPAPPGRAGAYPPDVRERLAGRTPTSYAPPGPGPRYSQAGRPIPPTPEGIAPTSGEQALREQFEAEDARVADLESRQLPEGFDELNAILNEPDIWQPPEEAAPRQERPTNADVATLGAQLARNLQRAEALSGRPPAPPLPPQRRLPGMAGGPPPTFGGPRPGGGLPPQSTGLFELTGQQPKPPTLPMEPGAPVQGAPAAPRPRRRPPQPTLESLQRPGLPLPEPPPVGGPPAKPDPLQALIDQIEAEHKRTPSQQAEDIFDPHRDQLTGLGGRRAWEQAGHQPGVLFGRLDMDNFKAVNDVHGHDRGDRALQIVGEVLKEFTQRQGDLAFRISGDEFGLQIQAPDTPEGITALRDRIEARIEERLREEGLHEAGGKRVGASLGFSNTKQGADQAAIARKAERRISKPREGEGGLPQSPTGNVPPTGEGGVPGERPPGGTETPRTDAITRAADKHWPTVRDAAVKQGWGGPLERLRQLYYERVALTRSYLEDLQATKDQYGHEALLREIRARGGINPYQTPQGTRTHYRPGQKVKPEEWDVVVQAFNSKASPYYQMGGASIIRKTGGQAPDDMAQSLSEDPRFGHLNITDEESLRALLHDIARGVGEVDIPDFHQALRTVGGVKPETTWWKDEGDTSFEPPEGEGGPPAVPELHAEARIEKAIQQLRDLGADDELIEEMRQAVERDSEDIDEHARDWEQILKDAQEHARYVQWANRPLKELSQAEVFEAALVPKDAIEEMTDVEREALHAYLIGETPAPGGPNPMEIFKKLGLHPRPPLEPPTATPDQLARPLQRPPAEPTDPLAQVLEGEQPQPPTQEPPPQPPGEEPPAEPPAGAPEPAPKPPTPPAPAGGETLEDILNPPGAEATSPPLAELPPGTETAGQTGKLAQNLRRLQELMNKKTPLTTAELEEMQALRAGRPYKPPTTPGMFEGPFAPGEEGEAPAEGGEEGGEELGPITGEGGKPPTRGERVRRSLAQGALDKADGGTKENPYYHVPFEVAADAKLAEIEGTVDYSKPSLERIEVSDLGDIMAAQGTVNHETLLHYGDNPPTELTEIPPGSAGRPNEKMPQVLRTDSGDLIVIGGTHRIVTDWLADPDFDGFNAIVYPQKPKGGRVKIGGGTFNITPAGQGGAPPPETPPAKPPEKIQGTRPSGLTREENARLRDLTLKQMNKGPAGKLTGPEQIEFNALLEKQKVTPKPQGGYGAGDTIRWKTPGGEIKTGTFHQYDNNGDVIVRDESGKLNRVRPWYIQKEPAAAAPPAKPPEKPGIETGDEFPAEHRLQNVIDALRGPDGEDVLQQLRDHPDGPKDRSQITPHQVASILERSKQSKWHKAADALGAGPIKKTPAKPAEPMTPEDEHFVKVSQEMQALDPDGKLSTQEWLDEFESRLGRTLTDNERAFFNLDPKLKSARQKAAETPAPNNDGKRVPIGLRSTAKSLKDIETRHEVEDPKKVESLKGSMERVGWKGRPALVVRDGNKYKAWTATHRLAAADAAGLDIHEVPIVEVDGQLLKDAGYDLDKLAKQGKKKRIQALRDAGLDHAADLLANEQVGSPERTKTPEEGAADVEPIPDNVRDFLKKQLNYTDEDLAGMTAQEAQAIGDKVKNHPGGVKAGIAEYALPKPAEVVHMGTGPSANLGEGSLRVQSDELAKLLGIAERRTQMARTRVEPTAPGTPTQQMVLSPKQLARASELAASTSAARAEAAKGPAPEKTQSEIASIGAMIKQMARRRGELLKNPTPENLDEYVRLAGEAHDRQSARETKGGTRYWDPPRRHDRTGEYLASGFAGLEDLFKNRPDLLWQVLRTTAGGLFGAMMSGDDDSTLGPDRLVGFILGAAAGYGSPAIWKYARAKAPTLTRTLWEMRPVKVGGREGVTRGVSPVRAPRDPLKDLGGTQMYVDPPYRAVPETWKEISPILDDLAREEALNPSKNALERRVTRQLWMKEVENIIGANKDAAIASGLRNHADYLQAMLDEVRGVPTTIERVAARVLSSVSPKEIQPKHIRQIFHGVEQSVYFHLLGAALRTGLVNRLQPFLTVPHIGVKGVVRGYKAARTPEGKALTEHLTFSSGPSDQPFMPGVTPIPMKPGLVKRIYDAVMSPVGVGDVRNLKEAQLGALYHAREMGLSEEMAWEWATDVTAQSQGVRGELGNNPFHRQLGPARMLTKYPVIWQAAMKDIATHPDPAVRRRAASYMLGLGAVQAATGIDLLNVFLPRLMLGVPAVMAGWDVYKHFVGGPTGLSNYPDHPLSDDLKPWKYGNAIIPKYLQQVGHELQDTYRYGTGPHPEFSRQSGQKIGEHTMGQGWGHLLGLDYGSPFTMPSFSGQTPSQKLRGDVYDYLAQVNRRRAYEGKQNRLDLRDAIESGDMEEASEIMQRMTKGQIADFYAKAGKTPYQILRERFPERDRSEFERRFRSQFGVDVQ